MKETVHFRNSMTAQNTGENNLKQILESMKRKNNEMEVVFKTLNSVEDNLYKGEEKGLCVREKPLYI